MILVSACLIGENCKYDGGNNYCAAVVDFLADKPYISICPEVCGGLATPRTPVEIINGVVIDKHGKDKSAAFASGAEEAALICNSLNIKLAILKEFSPSCGVSYVYDGSFSGRKISGSGITATLLRKNGVTVWSEKDVVRNSKYSKISKPQLVNK